MSAAYLDESCLGSFADQVELALIGWVFTDPLHAEIFASSRRMFQRSAELQDLAIALEWRLFTGCDLSLDGTMTDVFAGGEPQGVMTRSVFEAAVMLLAENGFAPEVVAALDGWVNAICDYYDDRHSPTTGSLRLH